MNFQKLNNITGWLVFALAFLTYMLTLEETASFWDCGEFIAVSYKLMVPHPPGAPFFLLMGRLFSFLSFGDVSQVAYWINTLSALCSAFTILFLFWTITLLVRRFQQTDSEGGYSLTQKLVILGSGAVGALAYTFSDSFWFSAVEAEVYAMSSFFTALVVWAMLKWEQANTEAVANRWLLFLAYMMGLSIGVHLLNLLAIPALGLIYYFKKYQKIDRKGLLITFGISGAIVLFITYGIIPGLPSLAGKMEIFFVNSLGLPFGSGAILLTLAVVGALGYGIQYSIKKRHLILNLSLLSLVFILIGYSSYAIILIRSNYNTPINENDPSDVMRYVSYLKREQYGSRPLIHGQSFDAPRDKVENGEALYRKAENEYEVYDHKVDVSYDSRYTMLFPRIYSTQDNHQQLYREKLGLQPNERATFSDNIRFFLSHQLGHMYFRYFMWNFAGRDGDDKEATWLSPFSTSDIPQEVAQNKSYDNYFMLPLLLGILGLFYQSYRDPKGWGIVLTLFFMLGVAIVLYINSPPIEPRERDYVYVGSFYAFCIWIGLGMAALSEWLSKAMGKMPASGVALLVSLFVPALMAAKGWDNHNRSNRFLSIDQARNTLASCAPNAILFTGGDNDTFPLWYVQEVEGYRTDVRVAVLSYFNTDWYIDQMKRPVYDSEALPISFEKKHYIQGKNDFLPIVPQESAANGMNLRPFLEAVKRDDKRIQVALSGGSQTAALPTSKLILRLDSAKIANMDFIPKNKKQRVAKTMEIRAKSTLLKGDMIILDLLANSDWQRPIYFNNTSAYTSNLELSKYLHLEGMVYRVMPILAEETGDVGEVSADKMLENIKNFQFRGMTDGSVYYDEEYRKFVSNFRNMYWRLGFKLMREGRNAEAVAVLEESMSKLPDSSVAFSFYMPRYVDLFHLLKEDEKAKEVAEILARRAGENLDFVIEHKLDDFYHSDLTSKSLYILRDLARYYKASDDRAENRIKLLQAQRQLAPDGTEEAEIVELKARQQYFSEYFIKYDSLLQEKMQFLYPN